MFLYYLCRYFNPIPKKYELSYPSLIISDEGLEKQLQNEQENQNN